MNKERPIDPIIGLVACRDRWSFTVYFHRFLLYLFSFNLVLWYLLISFIFYLQVCMVLELYLYSFYIGFLSLQFLSYSCHIFFLY